MNGLTYQNRRIWPRIKNIIIISLSYVFFVLLFIIGLSYFACGTFSLNIIADVTIIFSQNYIFAIMSAVTIMISVTAYFILDNKYEDKSKKTTLKSGILLGIAFAGLSAISEFIKWDTIQNMSDLEIALFRIADKGSFLFYFSMFVFFASIAFLVISCKKNFSKLTVLIPAFLSIISTIIINKLKMPDYKLTLAYFLAVIGIVQLIISAIPNEDIINKIFYVSKGVIFMSISLVTIGLSLASVIIPVKSFSTFSQEYLDIYFENGMQIFSLIACVPAILLFILAIFYIRGKNPWESMGNSQNSYSSSSRYSGSHSSSSSFSSEIGSNTYGISQPESTITADFDDYGYDGTDIDVSDM